MFPSRDDRGNGISNGNGNYHGIPFPIGNPMVMGIDDKIGNGNGKERETTCMGMGMALIPMGMNFHRRMQYQAHSLRKNRYCFIVKFEYH